MTLTSIPDWTPEGLLPPIGADATSLERSPYRVSLVALVDRFATSPERVAILAGLLRYRAVLHSAGVTSGFQWCNGSFAEDVERRELRAPNDIDVVTFLVLPTGTSEADVLALVPVLFTDDAAIKAAFRVDGYFVNAADVVTDVIRQTTYWYSMWSHRRDEAWKGYLQIDLAPDEDAAAATRLRGLPCEVP